MGKRRSRTCDAAGIALVAGSAARRRREGGGGRGRTSLCVEWWRWWCCERETASAIPSYPFPVSGRGHVGWLPCRLLEGNGTKRLGARAWARGHQATRRTRRHLGESPFTLFGWWGGGLVPCCSLLLAAAAAAESSPHPASRTQALTSTRHVRRTATDRVVKVQNFELKNLRVGFLKTGF